MADTTTTTTTIRIARTNTGAGPTLQQFADATAACDGVSLVELSPIEELEVCTRNTVYRITVLSTTEARVLVQGGRYFPIQSEVRLNGSTLGGSLLKVGWVGCGFCMEFMQGTQRITTTRVREIRRVEHVAAQGLH